MDEREDERIDEVEERLRELLGDEPVIPPSPRIEEPPERESAPDDEG